MSRARIKALVRQFAQNGIKLLLENPRNVRELLAIAQVKVLDLIDFERMSLVPTSFVQRDYRHVEADVVLRAPVRRSGKGRARRSVTIYILIEHQSRPDLIMILRALDYVVQIYKSQVRAWRRRHRSDAGLRLHPVLPVVLYTGARRWKGLGKLVDLIEMSSCCVASSSTWRRCRRLNARAGWNYFPSCKPSFIMNETRPSIQACN